MSLNCTHLCVYHTFAKTWEVDGECHYQLYGGINHVFQSFSSGLHGSLILSLHAREKSLMLHVVDYTCRWENYMYLGDSLLLQPRTHTKGCGEVWHTLYMGGRETQKNEWGNGKGKGFHGVFSPPQLLSLNPSHCRRRWVTAIHSRWSWRSWKSWVSVPETRLWRSCEQWNKCLSSPRRVGMPVSHWTCVIVQCVQYICTSSTVTVWFSYWSHAVMWQSVDSATSFDARCLFVVTTELVRLTTENEFLTQAKEEMKSNVEKLSQRVASMVSLNYYCVLSF